MSKRKKKYLVLKRIWHTADEQYYDPGAKVGLDHLNEEQIAPLQRQGVIGDPLPEEKKVEKVEVKDGSDN